MEKTITDCTSDWNRIRRIFEDVLEQPVEQRRRYAEEICGDDSFLLEEVRSLIDSHETCAAFLEDVPFVQLFEDSQSSDQLVSGQRLLHYEIRELIGKGGMGEVYLARDTKLDRNVAVKLLREDLVPQVRASDRLLREARAAALLEHPNICHIHEISEADGFSFIVMQYIVGTTLDEILSAGGTDLATALDLGVQIAEGLAEAHSQGIIHRDIKPANIVISERRKAKILDFGLAKFIEAGSSTEGASRVESTGGVMGTIPYMSPEQLSGRPVDARTDVFSFGSLLFEMITGNPAFRRERNPDTISAILTEEPDWTSVSPILRPLLERCLAKDPANRYPSAGKVAEALAAVQKLEPAKHLTRSRPANARSKTAATDQSDALTVSNSMAVTQAFNAKPITEEPDPDIGRPVLSRVSPENTSDRSSMVRYETRVWYPFPDLRTVLAGIVGAIILSTGVLSYYQFSLSSPISKQNFTPPRRVYWELGYTDKRKFIRNRITQIQMLLGDEPRDINDESFEGIFKEVEWYVSRRDSLSQEPFKEGLRIVYGRASQYVPMVSAEFEKEKVPIAIGIYQAVVESEYRDCLENVTGPTGIFQLTKATAERFGLAAQDRCNVDLSSKAAAAYNADLRSSFGSEDSGWTLTLLSFHQGADLTHLQVKKLAELGLNEHSYWAISENRERFSDYQTTSDKYVRRFFAAAIIGENPEMFGLVTPPLSTIRKRTGQGAPGQENLATIVGGSFTMGRNDGFTGNNNQEGNVDVDGFRMGKTEVTNAEFAEFISATGYKPRDSDNFLAHWLDGRPMEGDENTPVRYVNIRDINAFITWRSQNDGIYYRLPTEQEWEYAARNGGRNTIYPWGNKFDARCAHINQRQNDPVAVGTKSCPNQWGVHDLIGNVFEWTITVASGGPGSTLGFSPEPEPQFIIRGGGAFDKTAGQNAIDSTFRYPVPASRRSPGLGFRLVTSQ